MTYKFGTLQGEGGEEYRYGDTYAHEVYPNWSRVTIGVSKMQIDLMLAIAKRWGGPYGILYVLVASRLGHEDARYQSPEPCLFHDLELFADKFQEYFEGDGRHHLWFIDVPTNRQLIYDNHDLIYSYGNDEDVIALLKMRGLEEGNPNIPFPHEHQFNTEYDMAENEIMEYFEWIKYPLQEQDDP